MPPGRLTFSTLLLLASCMYRAVQAQETMKDFGHVAIEDFEIVFPMAATQPEAVVLFDVGKSHFVSDGRYSLDIVFERHVRIKINSNAGLRWAEKSILLYNGVYGSEVINAIEGFTYNVENGSITTTALDTSLVYEEKLSWQWHSKKFAMPAAREGSIIEFKYRLLSPYSFNLSDWAFQSKIPSIYSSYEVRLTPFYEYTYMLTGGMKLDIDTSFIDNSKKRAIFGINFDEIVYQFAMKNVPAFEEEEHMGSEDDFIARLDFQLSKVNRTNGTSSNIKSTWPELISDLSEHMYFGKYAESANTYVLELKPLKLETLSKEEKTYAIAEYIRSNYRWNGNYGIYANRAIKDVHKSKSGNAAEINLFLAGLLRARGIEANPVILSTRGNGKIFRQYPFIHYFNYVVVLVDFDGKSILIDATESLSSYDELPVRCLNDLGLVIKNGFDRWIPLKANNVSVTEERLSMVINEEFDSVTVTGLRKVSGHAGTQLRKTIEDDETKMTDYLKGQGLVLRHRPSSANYLDPSQPYQLNYSASVATEILEGKLYISPFLNLVQLPSEFQAGKRKYPLEVVYPREHIFDMDLKIPDGYQLEKVPANFKLANILYEVHVSVDTTMAGLLKIRGSFYIKQPTYLPEHYLPVKMGLVKAVDLLSGKIVLIPKKD